MKLYKVLFTDNVPSSSAEIDRRDARTVRIERFENKRLIRWITIHAENVQESIVMAREVVKDIAEFLLPRKR